MTHLSAALANTLEVDRFVRFLKQEDQLMTLWQDLLDPGVLLSLVGILKVTLGFNVDDSPIGESHSEVRVVLMLYQVGNLVGVEAVLNRPSW